MLLAGCDGEDDFVPRFAVAWCDAYEACVPAGFEQVHGGSQLACREDASRRMDRIRISADALGCPWDPDAERACFDAIEADCASFDPEALFVTCAQAWACGG